MAFNKNKTVLSLGISNNLNNILNTKSEITGTSKAQIILQIVNNYFEKDLINEYIEEIKRLKSEVNS